MKRKDLFNKHFNTLDLALEDSHGQWFERWSATDAVDWAQQANADMIDMMIINEWGFAYFQTDHMPPHPQLDGTDRLAELIDVAHDAGILVSGMWGPSANPVVCKKHPDWASIRADGSPYKWGYLHIAPCEVACVRSPYGKVVLDTLKDLYSRYAIDAVCFDFLFTSPCFCGFCRDAVEKELGLDMDQFDDWNALTRATYESWKTDFFATFIRKCTNLSERMGRLLINCHDYSAHYYFCEPHTGGHINIRDKGYIMRQEAAAARAHGKDTVVCTPYGHRYYIGLAKPPAHMRQEFREIMASGDFKLWPVAWDWELVKDPSGLKALGQVFAESRALSRFTHGAHAVPHIALLNSSETLAGGGTHATLHADGMKGVYDVLTRAHVPCEIVDSVGLKASDLKGHSLLVLSNVARLSDDQAQAIRRFVRSGGNLVATYQTSMYDEVGRTRYDFALSDLFGCHFKSQIDEPWTYIGAMGRDGVGAGFPKDYLLVHGDHDAVRAYIEERKEGRSDTLTDSPAYANAQCVVEPYGKARSIAEIFSTDKRYGTYFFKDQTPPQPGPATGRPAVLANRFGKGTVYYVAGQPDRVFYRVGHPDHERFVRNLLDLAAGEASIQVQGPTTVETTYFQKGRTILVHLLNHTYDQMYPAQHGTMGPYGDFTHDAFRAVGDIIPVSGLRLQVRGAEQITSVEDALTGNKFKVTRKENQQEVRLPQLKEYQALVLKLAPRKE